MKLKLFILLFISIGNLVAQNPLLREIKQCTCRYKHQIKEKFQVVNDYKLLGKEYKHILFIPFLYLKNVDLTQELIISGTVDDALKDSLKEHPTVDNLQTSANFPHHAIIYDDNLRVLDDFDGYFCVTPPHAEALLKCYKEINPQLLFYIWGLNDLFVLIDNRIYQLAYNQTDDTFSKVEL